jgi:hypothetical protein
MGDLSERDVEDVLGGLQPPGRDDLAHVVELTTWLHASSEIEPPPAMRDDLFSQVEAGHGAYQRSSRRRPAHLRHPRVGTGRLVRQTLAGSGRPIASIAAAAVLLVGVILAVRSGGPQREPSAFVSPSAQGVPTSGDDTSSTGTSAASTTTSPPETATTPDASATTVPDPEPSPTAQDTRESTRSSDTASADPRSRADGDTVPPTTEEQRGASDDDSDDGSEEDSSGGHPQASSRSDPDDDTTLWTLPLSGWAFDLSDWPAASDLLAALGDVEETDDAADAEDDAGSDDQRRKRRAGDGEGEHHRVDEGESERDRVDEGERERDRVDEGESDRHDDGDPYQEGRRAD